MARATIFIGANTKEANSALDKTGSKVVGFGKTTVKASAKIAKSLTKLTAGFIALAGVIAKKSIDAYMAQENAEKRLETIMRNTIKASDDEIRAFKENAKALQQLTTLGDEVIIAGQSQIASFTNSAEVVRILTGDIADLAVAQYGASVSQEQMIQTANMVGKAVTGQLGSMTRAGVLVSEDLKKAFEKANTEEERAAIISQILKDNYGGLAQAAANTAQGGLLQLKNMIGDTAEEIGAELIPAILGFMPAIKDGVSNALPDVKNVMSGLFGLFTGDRMAARKLDGGISSLIKNMITGITKAAPTILKAFVSIVQSLVDTIKSSKGDFAQLVYDVVTSLLPVLLNAIPDLIVVGIQLFTALLEGLGQIDFATIIPEAVQKIVDAILANLEVILYAGIEIALSLLTGIIQALPIIINGIVEALPTIIQAFLDAIPMIIDALIENAPLLLDAAWELIKALGKGLYEAAVGLYEIGKDLITKLGEKIKGTWGKVKEWGKEIVVNIATGILMKIYKIKNSITDMFTAIKEKITGFWENLKSMGKDIIDGIVQGIKDKAAAVWEALKSIVTNAISKTEDELAISSPSKVFKGIGKNIVLGWAKGIVDNSNLLGNAMGTALNKMSSPLVATAGNAGSYTTNETNYFNTEYNMSASGRFVDKSAVLELQRLLDDAKALENKRRGI